MIGIIETEVDEKVMQFVRDTNERIETGSITKSPFIGELKSYGFNGNCYIYFNIKSLYPNIGWYVIILLLIVVAYFRLSIWFTLLTIPFLLMEYFNTNYFFSYIMKKGLKKKGYTGKFILINEPLSIAMEMVEYVPTRFT
jgi:hypothetical protein